MRTKQSTRSLCVFRRDDFTCRYCGGKVRLDVPEDDPERATVDHVVPKSKGGRSTYDNLVTAHFRCNQIKANRSATMVPVHARGRRLLSPMTFGPAPARVPEGAAFRQQRWRFAPPE